MTGGAACICVHDFSFSRQMNSIRSSPVFNPGRTRFAVNFNVTIPLWDRLFGFFQFQPSELLKVILVIFLAGYLDDKRSHLYLFDIAARKEALLTPGAHDEWSPSFSPDGRFLVYASNESGRNEVYVQSFPGPGRTWQISTAGGDEPRWRRDERP